MTLYKVVPRMDLGDSNVAENVFYWETFDTGGSEDQRMGELAQCVDDLYDIMKSKMSNRVSFQDILIQNLTAQNPSVSFAWPTLTAGTGTSDILPPGVAMIITATTQYLRTYARKYIPGLDETQWETVAWATAAVTQGLAFGIQWLTPYTGLTTGNVYAPVLLRSLGGIAGFTAVFVRSEPGYQRRRRGGVGS